MATAATPTVLYPLTLPALLDHVLTTQTGSPTTLIVCSSRSTFLQALLHALQDHGRHPHDALGQLATPTIHNLLTARHVELAFCASVQALLAYLTACGRPAAKGIPIPEGPGKKRLVLVNPLALHAPTPSFSAQGLSRTFAAAFETALRLGARLSVVECDGMWKEEHFDEENKDIDVRMGDDAQEVLSPIEQESPWEQEVPILNVSARKYGSGSGERAWAGRTVKINTIAGRWFHISNVDDLGELE